jgi:hypothetical protein
MRPGLLSTLLGVALSTACGPPAQPFSGCSTPTDGQLYLLWTLSGQAADAQACASVAKLVLVMSPDACTGSVEISPIPCERDGVGWRYEMLPRGAATVELTAYDAAGRRTLSGLVRVDVEPAPQAPTPVDLR